MFPSHHQQPVTTRAVLKLLIFGLLGFYLVFPGTRVRAETVSNTVPLTGVNRVQYSGSGELHLTQGDEEYVKVTTDRSNLPRIDARVRGSVLYLSPKRGSFHIFDDSPVRFDVQLREYRQISSAGSGDTYIADLDTGDLKLYQAGSGDLTMSDLKAGDVRVKISGSGDLKADHLSPSRMSISVAGSSAIDVNAIDTGDLEVRIAGSGELRLDELHADHLDISTAGSADIRIAGRVADQRLEISGSGDYTAHDLDSDTADIEVHGSADVVIRVEKQLTTDLSKGATVIYKGGPDLEIDASGRGRLRRAD